MVDIQTPMFSSYNKSVRLINGDQTCADIKYEYSENENKSENENESEKEDESENESKSENDDSEI